MKISKKQTILISQIKDEFSDDTKSNHRPNIFITDESSIELIYMDILDNIMTFIQNVRDMEGHWR